MQRDRLAIHSVGLAGMSHPSNDMDPANPSPFGYNFDDAAFDSAPPPGPSGGLPLLNAHEADSLSNFFSQGPFAPDGDSPFFASHQEPKSQVDDWNWYLPPPPAVHQVSTIPDQSQLHRGVHGDNAYIQDPQGAQGHLPNTADDLQAASALYNNMAMHPNPRSYSTPNGLNGGMHGLPLPGPDTSAPGLYSLPMVPTSNGLLPEQLTAMIPLHSNPGTFDSQIANQFTHIQNGGTMPQLLEPPRQMKRPYSYGTDTAFNASGFSSIHSEDAVTHRLMHNLAGIRPFVRAPGSSSQAHEHSSPIGSKAPTALDDSQSDQDNAFDDDASGYDEEEDRATKKRRTTTQTSSSTKTPNGQIQSISSSASRPPNKKRKSSSDDDQGNDNSKNNKKRLSAAGQKALRENLTDEQKRSNHIHSEQKRRNLIKRGFDDLHDLVPEIRNGGLSKSSILTEAANFLEDLLKFNKQYLKESLGTAPG